MMKQNSGACDHGRHSRQTAGEKINGNFPCPNRRFDHRLPVVTGLAWNRAACNIDTLARYDSVLPRLLPQLFESLFGWRIGRHEKNANATSVAMIDAIAVANAQIHADFR